MMGKASQVSQGTVAVIGDVDADVDAILLGVGYRWLD